MADSTPTTVKPTAKKAKRISLPTGVLCIDLSANANQLWAACQDGVYEVNPVTDERKLLYTHESYASGAALFEKTATLVSSGYDGTLTWYDLAAGKKIRTVKAHDFWSWQLAKSPDGKMVASVTGQYLSGGPRYAPAPEREPSIKVYDVASGNLLKSFPHVPSVQAVAFSPDSRFVAAGNLMGEVRIYDVQTGQQAGSIKTDGFTSWGVIKNHFYLGGVFGLHFTPDGEDILLTGMGPMEDPMAGNGRQLWQRWSWKKNPAVKVDETHFAQSGDGLMETLAVHPADPYFVMSGRLRGGNWNTGFFSLKSGDILHSLSTDTRITRARFTADGKHLFLGGMKGQPGFKDGKIPDWGHVDIYDITTA